MRRTATALILTFTACAHTTTASAPAGETTSPGRTATLTACQRGDAASCRRLAERVITGARPAEMASYAPAFKAGCAARAVDACAGALLVEASSTSAPATPEDRLRRLSEVCVAGSAIACAVHTESQMRAAQDDTAKAAAAQAATEACERLGGSPCFTLATYAANGLGLPADTARATALLQKACDTGSGYACYVQGLDLAEGGKANLPAARAAYEKACTAEVAQGCFNLAYQLFAGEGGAEDLPRGRQLADHACALGDPKACDFLAATDGGRVAPKAAADAYPSPEAAMAANLRYCERGGAAACVRAAFPLGDAAERSGELEKMDDVLRLLQLGCDRGATSACNALGHVVKDALKNCAAGNAGQCLVAGFAWQRGVSLSPINGASMRVDSQKAREAFARACSGGRKSACARAVPVTAP